jgi:hypothetical protein
MDPRYFGTVNRGRKIPPMRADCPRLRQLSAIQVRDGSQPFVDSGQRFGLYNNQLAVIAPTQAALGSG